MGDLITRFLITTLVMAAPMLIGAMGTLFIERSGIINIGNEGFMIIGAFMGVLGSYYSGSALVGALTAMGAGLVFGLIFALFTVTFRANQVVTGLAINAVAEGLTSLLFRQLFGISGVVPKIATFEKVSIPLLSQIPILGPSLFDQTLVAYLGLLLVPVTAFVLYKTKLGLTVRSVGENPKACDTMGRREPGAVWLRALRQHVGRACRRLCFHGPAELLYRGHDRGKGLYDLGGHRFRQLFPGGHPGCLLVVWRRKLPAISAPSHRQRHPLSDLGHASLCVRRGRPVYVPGALQGACL